jgi:uncharacterized protein (DUF1778 family)
MTGYDAVMVKKVTVSIPVSTESRARRAAERAGLNFSQFIARAADSYAREVEEESLTEQINRALVAGGSDSSGRDAARANLGVLRGSEW